MFTRRLCITILLYTTLSLSGCAAYTVASMTTGLVTGKTITDRGISAAAQGDCNSIHIIKDKYYCEMPVRYNQAGF
jgi:hypothetical protein